MVDARKNTGAARAALARRRQRALEALSSRSTPSSLPSLPLSRSSSAPEEVEESTRLKVAATVPSSHSVQGEDHHHHHHSRQRQDVVEDDGENGSQDMIDHGSSYSSLSSSHATTSTHPRPPLQVGLVDLQQQQQQQQQQQHQPPPPQSPIRTRQEIQQRQQQQQSRLSPQPQTKDISAAEESPTSKVREEIKYEMTNGAKSQKNNNNNNNPNTNSSIRTPQRPPPPPSSSSPFTALLSSVSRRLPPSSATAKLMSRTLQQQQQQQQQHTNQSATSTTTRQKLPSFSSFPKTIGGISSSMTRPKYTPRGTTTPLSAPNSHQYYTTPSRQMATSTDKNDGTKVDETTLRRQSSTGSSSHPPPNPEIMSEISSTTSLSSYERRKRVLQLPSQTTPRIPTTPSTIPPTTPSTVREDPSLHIPSSPQQHQHYDDDDDDENDSRTRNEQVMIEEQESSLEETTTTTTTTTPHYNSLEEEPTAEEGELVDAACLKYKSCITIQSLQSTFCVAATNTATTSSQQQEQEQQNKGKYLARGATLSGSNTAMETFRILPADPDGYDDDTSFAETSGENSKPIRYGDTVALVSTLAQDRALGVRIRQPQIHQPNHTNDSTTIHPQQQQQQRQNTTQQQQYYELGFFRSGAVLGHADKWTILSGDVNRVISVGTYAVEKLKSRRRTRGFPPHNLTVAAVRSGDCILLRNESTGGLLSLEQRQLVEQQHNHDGEDDSHPSSCEPILTLVTDSYESDPLVDAQQQQKQQQSILGRIQSHGQIRPRTNTIFRLIHASVPQCPPWSSSSSIQKTGFQRPFLDGTYLLHSKRHSLFERKLEEEEEDPTLVVGVPPVKSTGSSTHYSIHEQERLLIDEVLGAMVGLEGQFIRFRSNKEQQQNGECCDNDDHMKKETCSRQHMDTSEFSVIRQQSQQGSTNETQRAPSSSNPLLLDLGLSNLVEKILPLPTAYVRVRAFVSAHLPGYEYGTVMQALCEALDYSLQEYLDFCLQMGELYRKSTSSNLDLTINQLYVHVKPAIATMAILQRVVQVAAPHKGGALLNSLHSLLMQDFAGDEQGQRALEFLLEKASIPYMTMLNTWLNAGVLNDPYDEFMVESHRESNQSIQCVGCDGDDWKDLYHIRDMHVLANSLSDESVKHNVLMTGKYWNAVRDCQYSDDVSQASNSMEQMDVDEVVSTISYNMNFVTVKVQIDQVYRKAAGALLRLLLRDFRLMQSLRTLKRYFLMDQGDFFVHFLDAAEEDLLHELEHVSRGRIQYLLAMSVQLTEQNEDDDEPMSSSRGQFAPLTAQSIRCTFSSESLIDHLDALHVESGGIKVQDSRTPSRHAYGLANKGLTGIEAFMLHFPVISFPTSLVISERSLASYQLLFRHLFFAKHVERRLVNIWLDQQMMKELQSLRKALGPTYCLRQRMLHFMQNLIYYMMYEVIEPNWLELETAVRAGEESVDDREQPQYGTRNADDVLDVHDEFLRRSLEECLLTDPDLIATLTKLMSTCLLFSDQMKRFMTKTKIFEEKTSLNLEKQRMQQQSVINPDTMKTNRALRKNLIAIRDERRNRLARQTARVERELTNESYKRMISRYDEVFNDNLGEFVMQLKEGRRQNWHGENLFLRLDYNGYVTKSMGMD